MTIFETVAHAEKAIETLNLQVSEMTMIKFAKEESALKSPDDLNSSHRENLDKILAVKARIEKLQESLAESLVEVSIIEDNYYEAQ